jgi:hypothetical protein
MTAVYDDEHSELDAVLNGWVPLSALSDKQVGSSLPKSVRALFKTTGLDPKLRKLYDDLTIELYERADAKLRGALLDAVDVMIDVMDDVSNDPRDRMNAAKYVFERIRGKTPEVVEVRQDKPFHVVFERLSAELPLAPTVVDGEIISGIPSLGPGERPGAVEPATGIRVPVEPIGPSNSKRPSIDGEPPTAEHSSTPHLAEEAEFMERWHSEGPLWEEGA